MSTLQRKSCIAPNYWEKVTTAFLILEKENIPIEFPPEYKWKGIPVGEYLERMRQYRCMEKLTREEMVFFQKHHIDLQYRERRWSYMYDRAKQYYQRIGHLFVSRLEDQELADWIAGQRKKYRGAPRKRAASMDQYAPLTDRQKQLLEAIDIVWELLRHGRNTTKPSRDIMPKCMTLTLQLHSFGDRSI